MAVPLKVFISSAMNEFKGPRKALDACFEQAASLLPGLLEGWVFEYTPAAAVGGEEAYLRHVRDCDVFVLVFGVKGTRPAVLRECKEAVKANKPILAFAQTVVGTREPPGNVGQVLKGLESRTSYRLFDDPAEIVELVVKSLSQYITDVVRGASAAHGQDEEAQGELHHEHPGLPARRKFFDRVEVLKKIARLLGDEKRPVIWLGGEGGLGKTALALEAAWRNAWRFPGVLWVPFDRTPPTLGSILAVAERDLGFKGEGTPRQRCAQLASRGHLFVLDNLDEVLDAAQDGKSESEQVLRWLDSLPAPARVIYTSRRSARLACQAAPTLHDLPVEASVELLVLAAGGRHKGWDPSKEPDLSAMKAICLGLGNLPLAIELAGARAQETDQDSQSLLAGLEEALEQAELGGKETQRERSLRGCLEYSFKLVQDKPVRAAVALLAAFPAVDEQMARQLLGRNNGLAELTILRIARQDRSQAGQQYWYALPPVRQTARKWLDKDEVDHALVQGVEYIESLAAPQESDANNAVSALLQLTPRRTFLFAHRVHRVLNERGFWVQARLMRQLALGIAAVSGPEAVIFFWRHSYAISLCQQGEFDEAEELCKSNLKVAERLDSQPELAATCCLLARIAEAQGNYEEAEKSYLRAVDIFCHLGNRPGTAIVYGGLGNIALARGRLKQAKEFHVRSLEMHQKLKDQTGIASALHNLGHVAYNRGALVEAQTLYNRSLEVSERIPDPVGGSSSLINLGVIDRDCGRYEEARALFERARFINEHANNRISAAACVYNLGTTKRQWAGMKRQETYTDRPCRCSTVLGAKPRRRIVSANWGHWPATRETTMKRRPHAAAQQRSSTVSAPNLTWPGSTGNWRQSPLPAAAMTTRSGCAVKPSRSSGGRAISVSRPGHAFCLRRWKQTAETMRGPSSWRRRPWGSPRAWACIPRPSAARSCSRVWGNDQFSFPHLRRPGSGWSCHPTRSPTAARRCQRMPLRAPVQTSTR